MRLINSGLGLKIKKAIFFGTFMALAAAAFGAGAGEAGGAAPPASGKVLRIGTTNEIKAPFPFGDYYLGIFAKISNPPLMTMNEKGELVGLSAAGYRVSEDHKTWTFTIRDNLSWSDGKKLTSRDIAFSLAYTGNKNPNAGWIGRTLKEVRTPDALTVEFEFEKPYTNLNLEFTSYNILPEHIWSGVREPLSYGGEAAYVGHGPFVIDKVDLNSGTVVFRKNSHWKGTPPALDGIEVRVFKSMDILALSLERGEIDVFYNYAASYPYHYLEKLARKDEFRFEEKLNQGLVFLGFNLKKTPLGDPAFREALSFAVDYEEIIRVDALGYGRVPNRGFVPESMGGFITTEGLRHDPERAKALLETAGYRDTDGNGIREADGRELRLVLLIRPEFGRVAELLRDYLKNVGLAAEIKTVDASAWFKEKDEYRYDLTITRTTPWGMLMHAGLGTGYFDSRRTGQGVLHNLEDPAFLGIADAALSTTRGDKLAALAGDIQRYYAEKLPGIALYWNKIVTPYRKTVRGLKPNPLFGIYSIEGLIGVEKE